MTIDPKNPYVKLLTRSLLTTLCNEALASDRKRKNYNFHEHAETVQRFLNVLQPGPYVRPHHHVRPESVNGFEFFLVLQGSIGMVLLDDDGNVLRCEKLEAQGEQYGIEIPEGVYHTLVVLEPNSVILELKEGPYQPAVDKDFLSQFPAEGRVECVNSVTACEGLFR